MVIALLRLIFFAVVGSLVALAALVILGLTRARRLRVPRRPAGTTRGVMVKDEICGTYILREDAIVEARGGVEHYFCSENCRRKFLDG
jgi:YHS domain-containing protein